MQNALLALMPFRTRRERIRLRILWTAFLLPLIPAVLLAAEQLRPCARPPEIPPEEWKKLFDGTPQVIEAQIKASDGATYFSFINWNPRAQEGRGPIGSFVRVKDGKAVLLWTNDVIDGPPQPPWTSLGLALPEAVEMEKQLLRRGIRFNGWNSVKEAILKDYDRKPGTPIPFFQDHVSDFYPEFLEAAKELGLLPKDFVPPALAPEDQHFLNVMLGIEKPRPPTPEEEARNQAIQKKLSEMIRSSVRGEKKATEKANNELMEMLSPSKASLPSQAPR